MTKRLSLDIVISKQMNIKRTKQFFNIAMMLYIESGENVDFDDCLKAAESYMED